VKRAIKIISIAIDTLTFLLFTFVYFAFCYWVPIPNYSTDTNVIEYNYPEIAGMQKCYWKLGHKVPGLMPFGAIETWLAGFVSIDDATISELCHSYNWESVQFEFPRAPFGLEGLISENTANKYQIDTKIVGTNSFMWYESSEFA
jgi:hypothetical protein